MPTSKREAALVALKAALETVPSATVVRNVEEVLAIPAGGLITLRDGDPTPAEEVLQGSTPEYVFRHVATVVAEVQIADAAARDAAADALVLAILAALDADSSLGGAVQYLEPTMAGNETAPQDGDAAIKAVEIEVELMFSTTRSTG